MYCYREMLMLTLRIKIQVKLIDALSLKLNFITRIVTNIEIAIIECVFSI